MIVFFVRHFENIALLVGIKMNLYGSIACVSRVWICIVG